jgi:hypothetical protein
MSFTRLIELTAGEGSAWPAGAERSSASPRATRPPQPCRPRPARGHGIEVDFAFAEEAARNDDRSETQSWATKLTRLGEGRPTHRNLQTSYLTHEER